MSLAFLFHYLMLNMFRVLIHPSSGAFDLFVELFHGLYWSCTMRVGVTLWFGWGGVLSLRRLKQCLSLHKDTTPPQPNHTVTPTHIVPEQYNPWNNSTNKSQAPEDGCTFFIHLPLKMEPTEGSETSNFRTQTPGNYPRENVLYSCTNIRNMLSIK